ncbi:MAG TPA: FAD-dependent oxidoreductase, partial [Methanomassiliicoccales archaeon]|nr:FAD-dependent oxidoreductase [Methanomassiliicoccales archaeon]
LVFTEDAYVAYSPCAIPFVIEGKIKDFESIVMHTPEWYHKERNIAVRVRTKVTKVDVDAKKVTISDGSEITYDVLIIAAGGSVFLPPIEGIKKNGVFSVRWIDDGKSIAAALDKVNSVVVAGAGVIGLEMAVALKHCGKDVTVVEMFNQTIPRIFDEDMAKLVQDHCASLGIRFIMGTPLGSISGDGNVEKVTVGGNDVPCQMVVMATGVRPNLELPNQMGLDIGPLGAVRVSPTMQPYRKGRLLKDVFLAGDLVMCESAAAAGPTMSQLGSSAVRQGRVAGINATGGHATHGAVTSPFISVIGDIEVGGVGLSKGLADYYGIKVVEGKAEGWTRARYYPGGKKLTVKVLAEADTHRIIGSQIVGGEEVTGRVNWMAGAIMKGVTAEEFLAEFENAYCPPTSMVRDVVNDAVEDLVNRLKG